MDGDHTAPSEERFFINREDCIADPAGACRTILAQRIVDWVLTSYYASVNMNTFINTFELMADIGQYDLSKDEFTTSEYIIDYGSSWQYALEWNLNVTRTMIETLAITNSYADEPMMLRVNRCSEHLATMILNK